MTPILPDRPGGWDHLGNAGCASALRGGEVMGGRDLPARDEALPPALDECLRLIGSAGSTPWGATGRRPGAILRRAYLRALRPYLRRRAEVDRALLTAIADVVTDMERLRGRADDLERRLMAATGEIASLQSGMEAVQERARRTEDARALDRIAAATHSQPRLGATICTVVSQATMAHAHALGNSVARVHPGSGVLALVTDGEVPGGDIPFIPVSLEEALGAQATAWRRRHAGIALEYALAPSIIRHALDRVSQPALFIKQESMVIGDLRPIIDELRSVSVALTPHFVMPPGGPDAAERTRDVLLAGTLNGGVIAASNDTAARRAMAWWEERLAEECIKDVQRGRHFEQRWLDLMLATFDDAVGVIRRPGANIGHWNIADHDITGGPGCLQADGLPVAVLRFSGFDEHDPDVVTRYAPHRLREGVGPLTEYFAAFRHELISHAPARR